MHRLKLMIPAAICGMMMLCSCGGSGSELVSQETAGLPANPTDLFRQSQHLPLSRSMPGHFDGEDFHPELPHRNVSPLSGHRLQLSPDAPDAGPSFVIFSGRFDNRFSEAELFSPHVRVAADNSAFSGELTFMLADYTSARWTPVGLQLNTDSGEYEGEFSGWQRHHNPFGIFVCALVASGSGASVLRQISFGSEFRPDVELQLTRDSLQASGTMLQLGLEVTTPANIGSAGIEQVFVDYDGDGTDDAEASYQSAGDWLVPDWEIPAPGAYELIVTVVADDGSEFQHIHRYFHGTEGSAGPLTQFEVGQSYNAIAGVPVQIDATGSSAGDAALSQCVLLVDGHFAAASDSLLFEYMFEMPGVYQLEVFVADELYNSDSIRHRVMVAGDGQHWENTGLNINYYIYMVDYRLAEIAGRPAIAGWHYGDELVYARAGNSRGSSWDEAAQTVVVPAPDSYVKLAGLLETDGRPALYYLHQDLSGPSPQYSLRLRRGLDADGNAWSAENICFQFASDDKGPHVLQFLRIGGKPCIVYKSGLPGHQIELRLATDESGESWNDARSLPVSSDYFGRLIMTDWNGMPVAAYEASDIDAIMFVSADAVDASSWQPAVTAMQSAGENLQLMDIEIIAGQPAIAASSTQDDWLNLMSSRIAYVRSNDALAESWPEPQLLSGIALGQAGDLLDYNGLPAISYIGFTYRSFTYRLYMSVASDIQGHGWKAPVGMLEFAESDYYMHYSPGQFLQHFVPNDFDGQDITILCSGRPVALVRSMVNPADFAWFE